jgi:hypothetical protein
MEELQSRTEWFVFLLVPHVPTRIEIRTLLLPTPPSGFLVLRTKYLAVLLVVLALKERERHPGAGGSEN